MFISPILETGQSILLKRRRELAEYRKNLASFSGEMLYFGDFKTIGNELHEKIRETSPPIDQPKTDNSTVTSPKDSLYDAVFEQDSAVVETISEAICPTIQNDENADAFSIKPDSKSLSLTEIGQALLLKKQQELAEYRKSLSNAPSAKTPPLEEPFIIQTEVYVEKTKVSSPTSQTEDKETIIIASENSFYDAVFEQDSAVVETASEVLYSTNQDKIDLPTAHVQDENSREDDNFSPSIVDISLTNSHNDAYFSDSEKISDTTQQSETDSDSVPWDESLPSPVEGEPLPRRKRKKKKHSDLIETEPLPLILEHTTLYPSLCSAMLREENVHIGRIWWLLRAMDPQGSGKINIQKARHLFTDKDSEWRVCGWRQFRHILQMGQNIFWTRKKTTIWLKSILKVAIALNVEHFSNAPILINTKKLTESIGCVRATFYSTFHGGRNSNPIARETISDATGVERRSQLNYEQRSDIEKIPQFTISYESVENASYHHGGAVFQFTDYLGKQGPRFKKYWAWRLPNRYEVAYTKLSKRHHKRLNSKLNGLLNHGTTGNGQWKKREFYPNMKDALRATGDRYFPSPKAGFWYAVSDRTIHA